MKYLGVTIYHSMNILTESLIGLTLQRNITSCSLKVKDNCYKIMVRPIMEYACTVWSPYTRKNIQGLAAVQRRAAHFAKNDFRFTSSVTAMLQDLEWPTLEERRWEIKATILFKILHHLVCIPADQYLKAITDHARRHQQRLQQYLFSC